MPSLSRMPSLNRMPSPKIIPSFIFVLLLVRDLLRLLPLVASFPFAMAVPRNGCSALRLAHKENQALSRNRRKQRRDRKCVAASHLPRAVDLPLCFQRFAGSVKQLYTCEAATHQQGCVCKHRRGRTPMECNYGVRRQVAAWAVSYACAESRESATPAMTRSDEVAVAAVHH